MLKHRHLLVVSTLVLICTQRVSAQDSLRVVIQYTDPWSAKSVVVLPTADASKVAGWRQLLEATQDTTVFAALLASNRDAGLIAVGFVAAGDMISFAPPLIADYYSVQAARLISVDAQVDPQQAIQWLKDVSANNNLSALVELLNAKHAEGLLGIMVPAPRSGDGPVTMIRYGRIARSPQVKDNGGVTLAFSKMQPGDLEKAVKQHKTIKDPSGLVALARQYLDHGFKTSQIMWSVPQQELFTVTVWANR